MADTLAALRSLMTSHSPPLHVLIVPSEDYHQENSYMKENEIFVREYGEVSSDIVLLASDQLTSSSADETAGLNTKTITGKATRNGEIPAAESVSDLIWVDAGACCFSLYLKLNADKVLLKQSPLAFAKALKMIHTTLEYLIPKKVVSILLVIVN